MIPFALVRYEFGYSQLGATLSSQIQSALKEYLKYV